MTSRTGPDYHQRVQQQITQFSEPGSLSRLPPIYRYWSQAHIVPRVRQVFGSGSIFDLYFKAIASAAEICEARGTLAVIYSLGAGDCHMEISLALNLKRAQRTNVRIVCLELSPVRLRRASKVASERGVADLLSFVEADLNGWRAPEQGDVFIAHHTLHHVVELESLFDAIREAMHSSGRLLTADMIGRNGHKRWPEVLEWIEHLWRIMPDRYKFNFQFRKLHEDYFDWDCSASGFEGIRAQEVLPLLVARFDHEAFLGFGGVIDPFIERGYGHNLDPSNPKDTAFIDFVEAFNQCLLESGKIKPTMMFGTFGKRGKVPSGRYVSNLSPQFCVRHLP